nr:hypothetical protein [uncultured Duganella sp.]
MTAIRITPPTELPVSLDLAKANMRVDGDDMDVLITAAQAEALNSAMIAAAGAAAAVAATNVLPWVSGATYTAGGPGVGASVVSSPSNFKTYRRRTNGAGTTDPSLDTTNWQLISSGALPRLHVQEQRAANTQSATILTANSWSQRILNTQVFNSIAGSSLGSDTIILPPGTYQCDISAPTLNSSGHRLRLYNVTAASNLIMGLSHYTFSTNVTERAFLKGRFTLTATSTLRIDHFSQANTYGGSSSGSGAAEIYTDAVFEQLEN